MKLSTFRPYAIGALLAILAYLPFGFTADTPITPVVQQFSNDQSFTGSLSNGTDTITIALQGYSGLTVQATNTGANVGIVQVSNDGVTFRHSTLWKCGGSSAAPLGGSVTSIGEDSTYIVLDTSGMSHARISLSTFSAGTVNFTIRLNQITPAALLGAVATDGSAGAFRGMMISGRLGNFDEQLRFVKVTKDVNGVAVTAGTPVTIWTPAAGKKFRLLRWDLSLSVAGQIIFNDNATLMFRTSALVANTGRQSGLDANGFLSATANNPLKIDVSASGTVNGWVAGCEE